MSRILVVDDSPSMRALVSKTLESAGHHIQTAASGSEALTFTSKEKFQLVISDLNMPNMNGLEFVREFRRTAPFTPVLILTTEVSPERKQEARKAGATGWLEKPFDPKALLATILKVL